MKQPVYYMQTDPRWSNIPYTVDGDAHETIGYSGCGPTCAAMILAEWVDPKVTPIETCKMAIEMKDRTPNDGTEWEFFRHIAEKYSLPFKQTGITTDAVQALKSGALVVCSMGPGYFTKSGHFILAWGVDSAGNVLVNDPISKVRTKAPISTFQKECRQYFIFKEAIKPMNAKEILKQLNDAGKLSSYELWLKAIDDIKKVPGNLGDYQVLRFIDALIEKVYAYAKG